MKAIKYIILILWIMPLSMDAQILLLTHEKMRKKRIGNIINRVREKYRENNTSPNDTTSTNLWLSAVAEQIENEKKSKRQDSIKAERGSASDKLNYVLKYYDNLEKEEKEYFLSKSARSGNDSARCYLAQSLYLNCRLGHSEDVRQAYELLIMSEREGSKLCDYLLGVIYYNGNREANINRDYVKAVKYFLSVDSQSQYYRLSRYYLFKCYRYGRGVHTNIEKALLYLKEANIEGKAVLKQALERTSREEMEDARYLYNILKEEK